MSSGGGRRKTHRPSGQSGNIPRIDTSKRETEKPNSNKNNNDRPIGFKSLETAILTMEHSKLLINLSSSTFGFLTLLQQRSIQPGITCLILSALSKAVDSADSETRKMISYFLRKILPINNGPDNFMTKVLPIFVMNLQKYTSDNYNERERFIVAIFDLLKFIQQVQLILPQGSRDIFSDLVPGIQAQIEFINRKGNRFSSETMELLADVVNVIEKFNETEPIGANVEFEILNEPPEDFRTIQICPDADDILHNHEPFIRKNIVDGKYVGGVDHYLDVQFRLLREDFIRGFRDGIREYLRLMEKPLTNQKKVRINDINIYSHVNVVSSVITNGNLVYNAKFDTTDFKKVRWQFSKRLMTGSLICLSYDEFKTFCFATVTGARDPDKLTKGEFRLQFEFQNKVTEQISPAVPLKMAESNVYFEAYRHNLKVLQDFTSETFPLQRYIVEVNCEILPPPYLTANTVYNLSDLTKKLLSITAEDVAPNLESQFEVVDLQSAQRKIRWISKQKMEQDVSLARYCDKVPVLNETIWPDESFFGLDGSQFDALKAALTKQFAIIQGPPGTGKTYVGLRIAQALLQNVSKWGHSMIGTKQHLSPILVVCYTNHALDQFLEGMLQFCQSIIRIGGKSKSPLLEHFNLKNVRSSEQKQKKVPAYIFKNRKECREKLAEIQSQMSTLEASIDSTNKKLLNSELLPVIKELSQMQWKDVMELDVVSPITTWLGLNVLDDPGDDDIPENFDEGQDTLTDTPDEEFEIDGDEEEIKEMENMRLIDGDSDDDVIAQINPTAAPSPTICAPIMDLADGYQLQRHQKKIQKNRIKMELKKSEHMTEAIAKTVRDIWNLSQQEKWNLYRFWRRLYVNQIEEKIRDLRKAYSNEWVRFVSLRNQEDLEIVQGYSIIGMTTTGAAKYHHIIDGIKPRIIIVEEAAEVLEAHIVTSLCSKTDHLILIGDHQQLKPNPAVYELAKKFKLEVSLFERMIQNGIACHQLKLQHRMRPAISELLVPHFYKELMDHDSVKCYEDIKGVSCNMFFVNHAEDESKINDTMSRMNKYEAQFVVELCRYLILQGYNTSQITILTMYSGQLYQIKYLMKAYEILKGVRATVVDNYQGEENDIMILTFVRSNDDGEIGFLKVSNRVNVALSRARKGLYCIGNFKCLVEKSPVWRKIVDKLERQKAIGPTLELCCQNHPETLTFVTKVSDFQQCPEGGCLKPCDTRLLCGHVCQSICHIFDSDHQSMKCHKRCHKILCERGHRCKNKCHRGKGCGSCTERVEKLRVSCGHTLQVKCSESPESVFCVAPCSKTKSCGHKCSLMCGNNCEASPCTAIVDVKGDCGHNVKVKCSDKENAKILFESCKNPCSVELHCGHKCRGSCGECYRGRLHIKCKTKCTRPLVCGHLCNDICATNCPPCTRKCQNECSHSKCRMKCGSPCVPCQEPCEWVCEHKRCTKLCKENCDRVVCSVPCKKVLPCKHPCIGLCGEPCPKLCRICNKDLVEEILFGDEDEPDARFILLKDCNHIIEVNGLLNWVKLQDESNSNSGGMSIQMKTCPRCKTVIRQTKALNTFIQSCLRDLEAVKLKIFGNVEDNHQEQILLHTRISNHDIDGMDTLSNLRQIRFVYEQLLKHTKPNDNGLIGIPKGDIHKNENIYQIWTKVVETLTAFSVARRGTYKSVSPLKINQLELRANQVLCFIANFSNNQQEIEDVQAEVRLLQLSSKVAMHVNTKVFNDNGQKIIREAFDAVLQSRFTEDVKNTFEKRINEANKLQGGLGISLEEKNMILQVMGFSKGHWYKCRNGHIYCIGECGGAMQQSKCPECGSIIGGASHRLASDNAIATEMDGATAPSWPTNLMNELRLA
ncbi:NFX1-type zinc finger-containing protein 1-like [Bradysia coprophila]|uniref:NFX1-type zinc finger-containing protein 1-like n=1 Tax=Bradysia coprophila TaxID=38358 RepID=UPI00187D92D6|nr:NFX1-type zinc finger-containing protein 1-like [Bradysia coprophila]